MSERRRRVVEFGALHRQLARLAAHVDQLAQEADATGRLPAGTAETLVAVERLAGPLAQATEPRTAAFEKPAWWPVTLPPPLVVAHGALRPVCGLLRAAPPPARPRPRPTTTHQP